MQGPAGESRAAREGSSCSLRKSNGEECSVRRVSAEEQLRIAQSENEPLKTNLIEYKVRVRNLKER